MLPVLQGKEKSPRQEMFWELPGRYQAARIGRHKWVSSVPKGNKANATPTEGIFDLSVDPGEQHNLAGEKPEVLTKIRARFARWKAEMSAAEPRGPFRNF